MKASNLGHRGSQFYERTALSKSKSAILREGQPTPDDVMSPEEEIKDPFFFEFLNLEYSESDLEAALMRVR